MDLFLSLWPAAVLAQVPDFSVEPAFYAFVGMQLLGLLAKLGVLVWAYVKTRKPAAIAYAIYLFVQAVVPFLFAGLGPEMYARYAILLSFLEFFLFVWLIYSLSKRFRPAKPQDQISEEPLISDNV